MTAPLFIQIQKTLLNVVAVEAMWLDEETLFVNLTQREDGMEFEFATVAEAQQALTGIQKLLKARGLFLGQPI